MGGDGIRQTDMRETAPADVRRTVSLLVGAAFGSLAAVALGAVGCMEMRSVWGGALLLLAAALAGLRAARTGRRLLRRAGGGAPWAVALGAALGLVAPLLL